MKIEETKSDLSIGKACNHYSGTCIRGLYIDLMNVFIRWAALV